MNGVYISLNQGWTQYEAKYGIRFGRDEIKKNAKRFRSLLRSTLYDFSFEPINLNAENTLGKGYELGHICGLYYPQDDIPEDDYLVNDLRNLIGVYREIKGLVGKDILDLNLLHDSDGDDEAEPTPKEKLEINKNFVGLESPEEIRKVLERLEAEMQNIEPRRRKRIASAIARNKKVSDLIKREARYICSICNCQGFEKENGELYAEAHHIEELSKTLKDIPSNIMCVCPTCHRVIHYGNKKSFATRENLRINF